MREKGSYGSFKRSWKQKIKIISVIAAFIATAISAIIKADAAYPDDYSGIGTCDDSIGGKSITGARISKNSEILNYALDIWEKTSDNKWEHTGSNIDGHVSDTGLPSSNPVFIKGESGLRFGLNINSIKSSLPKDGSIVIKKCKRGKTLYKKAEYTYQTEAENEVDDSISLLKQASKGISKAELPSTEYSFESASYIYDIYDAAVIGQDGDICTVLDDCSIISEGSAYYSAEDEYIIRKLPIAEHNEMDGYTCSFNGWYTQEGYKLCTGDAIDINSKIYPRWDISRITYNVNYIDILGDLPDGKVLGTSTSTVYCNDEASGSDIGSDKNAGKYYKGLYYDSCTSVIVKEDCNVYRYFRPALYNIIFNGSMESSGGTAPLYNCTYGSTYKLTENGFKRNGVITLDLNAEDATCATKSINVAYKFMGWAETSSGSAVYTDCESVSDLCLEDCEKHLYAVWDGGNIEISAVPERKGYKFDGWSKDKSSTSGNTWFDVSGSNNCTLYAIWIKKEEDTDNNGTGDIAGSGETDKKPDGNNSTNNSSSGNTGSSNTSTDSGNSSISGGSSNTSGGGSNSTGSSTSGGNSSSTNGGSSGTSGGSNSTGGGSSSTSGGSSTGSGSNSTGGGS
ncbi:MAG TPA: hypothetical protein DCZ23_00665, partial [Lachnospiraceae bacterium]|nr:hypothetical protein [Lachnospiraceae bacterium]